MEECITVSSACSGGHQCEQRYIFEDNIEPSLSCTTTTPKPHQPHPHLRDPSFSSYLIRSPPPQPPQSNKLLVAREFDENEISIFEAEKYFSGTQQQQHKGAPSSSVNNLDRILERGDYVMAPTLTIQRTSSVSSSVDGYGYGRNYRTRSIRSTPTVSSESSWNSKSGLLPHPHSSIDVAMKNNLHSEQQGKKSGPPAKWLFGRKCCFGKKSIQVQENLSEPKIQQFHDRGFDLNSNSSLNSKKQRTKAGEVGTLDHFKPPTTLNEITKEFDMMSLGINERGEKPNSVTENWAKHHEIVSQSSPFTSEKMFPAQIGCRVVSSGRSFRDGGGFSFPVLNNPPASVKRPTNIGKPPSQALVDSTRESLDLFRLPEDSVNLKPLDVHRCSPMDHDNLGFNCPVSLKTRMATREEDVASDTSSDLFEIESFSTQTTSYPSTCQQRDYQYLEEISSYKSRRHSSDEPPTPSLAPTEFYEPSEVSIDWSVTTAEGFDQASFTNFSIGAASPLDYEEGGGGGGGGGGKMRGRGMLGCRCENAVNVGPNPMKHVVEVDREKYCYYGQSLRVRPGRVQAMSRLADISSMPPTRASIVKPPLPIARSRSARMYSHALPTH